MGEMSEFQAWSSTHQTIRAGDWNALLDHGLEKPVSYIIRKNGSYYEAINGSTGKIDYGGANNAGGVSGSDAATVIQQAINNGKSIFFKNGDYPLSSSLSITNPIIIDGEKQVVLKPLSSISWTTIGGQKAIIHIYDTSNVTIRNIKIDGNRAELGSTGRVIQCYNASHILIENVMITDALISGILINSECSDITVRQNIIDASGYEGANGVAVNNFTEETNSEKIYIIDNKFLDIGQGVNVIKANDVTVARNLIRHTGYYGVAMSAVYNFKILENDIKATSAYNNQHGIHVESGPTGPPYPVDGMIAFNKVDSEYEYGILAQGLSGSGNQTERLIIQSNIVRDSGNHGIYLYHTFHAKILSNIVINSTEDGIRLSYSSYCNVEQNTIRGSGGYGINLPYDSRCHDNIVSYNFVVENTYGVRLGSNTGENNSFTWNYLLDNLSGVAIFERSAIVMHNIGYVTKNYGTAIIPANTKSYQVSFEMAGTPTIVKVTPEFDVSGRWWISNLTWASGTSILSGAFTFNRTYSGLYSGIIHWNAEYKP